MKKTLVTFSAIAGLAALSIGCEAESNQNNATFAAPLLMAESGKNICQAMNDSNGSASAFELCVANGMFSHDVYDVRIAGTSIVKGIDDETTKGIRGQFYGNSVSLKCEPVNQLYSKITDKEIDEQAEYLKKNMPNSTDEERKHFAMLSNMVEVGRHCALSGSNGAIARLDVKFPD